VEGLKPEDVNVIDSKGNILSAFIQEEQAENNPENPDASTLTQQAKLALHQMEVQQSFEKDLEGKITSLLNKVLEGNSHFSVKVTAELNFDKSESDSEIFEPVVDGQGIPRSTQNKKEQYVGDGGFPASVVGGVPGTDSNIPGYQAVNGTNSQYSKEENTTNYEINRTVKHNVVAPGSPKRISVGVFVDNLQPQQVEAIKSAVTAAGGLDLNRGDQVDVENMPFDNTKALANLKETQMEEHQNMIMTLGKIGLLVLMAFGVLLFLRSLLKPKKEKRYVETLEEGPEEPVMMPQVEDIITTDVTAEDLARAEAARDAKKREAVRKEVFDMANKNPENIAQIIKKWLSEE
jgi:flagellar M-ring protein FliF